MRSKTTMIKVPINKGTILRTLGSLLTVILMYHIVNLSFASSYTHYLDSTEMTDYALLESLLLPKGLGLDNNDNSSSRSTNSMTDVHLKIDELKYLATIHTPSVKPTTTIIIQYESIDSLDAQLDSIHNQKDINTPSMIHIVCSSAQDEITVQNYLGDGGDKRKLQVSVIAKGEKNWYSHIKKINSDYVVLMDKGVVPGEGYLAFVLGLLHAPQFNHALIGTEPATATGKICQQDEAHHVHAIKDIFVLKREWHLQDYDLESIALPVSTIGHELHGNSRADCTNVTTGGLLFLYQNSVTTTLNDTICQFGKKQPQGQVIHVVTIVEGNQQQISNSSSALSCSTNQQDVVIIHHPVINAEEAVRIIYKLSPQVVIYEKMQQEENTVTLTAVDDLMKKQQAITLIGLPTKEIPLVTPWITELSIDTLQQWHVPKINLVLTAGGERSQQFKQLLHSIQQGYYLGDQVNIYIAMDELSDQETMMTVNDLNWKQGLKHLRHRISKVHPMQIFAEAWYPTHDHDYAVVLDDRIKTSPYYYIWLKYTLLKYRYGGEEQQQPTNYLFGISLYSPRIVDTSPSGHQLLNKPQQQPSYLMQHAASQFGAGGALYFPQHWREFHDYITARLTDQAIVHKRPKKNYPHLFKDSLLTIVKSDKWLNSWRKYFDEMIYMRGYVMLYPSNSYSTLMSIGANATALNPELYVNAERLYRVPLASRRSGRLNLLPDLKDMTVLDIFGKAVPSQTELVTRGHALQRTFSACDPLLNHNHDPSDMLCSFSKLIKVPKDQKENPTVITVDLYSPTPSS